MLNLDNRYQPLDKVILELASSSKTFFTVTGPRVFLGKNFSDSFVVMHAPHFVVLANNLYLDDSKNDRSFFLAICGRGFTSLTIKVFISFKLGKKIF